jgi:hypothetical protein
MVTAALHLQAVVLLDSNAQESQNNVPASLA